MHSSNFKLLEDKINLYKKFDFVRLFYISVLLKQVFSTNQNNFSLVFSIRFVKNSRELIWFGKCKRKYYWMTKWGRVKIYKSSGHNIPFLEFSNFLKTKHFYLRDRKKSINSLISIKKKSGMLKKNNSVLLTSLKKTNKTYKFLTSKRYKKLTWGVKNERRNPMPTKSFTLNRRWFRVFFDNRNIFRTIFNIQNPRQFYLTRRIGNFSKMGALEFLQNLEFCLWHLLIRVGFSYSKNDSIYLIESGWIFINGNPCLNPNYIVKLGDYVQTPVSYKYTRYISSRRHYIFRKKGYIAYRLWRLHRNWDDLYKQKTTHIPKKTLNYIFFGNDIPSYIEIDLTINCFCIIIQPTRVDYFSFYYVKFVNLFLLPLYNWKYIS